MPKITVLADPIRGTEQLVFDAESGELLLDALLKAGLEIEHACEKVGVCATCHVYVRSGSESLDPPDDREEDGLDVAWGLDPDSRLSCLTQIGDADLVIELPRYSRNLVAERG
jgi:2Fe-2S ferredoxin